jgi:succinylglutamate desuccinylase
MYPNSIIKKVGKNPGKTVGVFTGIHGNEKVGVLTLDKIIKEIEIESGVVYFVYANPPAIEQNIRVVNKNMNRLFSRSNTGDTYEDARVQELMDIMDECDALLDIHSYNSSIGDQFAITEENGFDLVSMMDFPIVASGFSNLGNGTDRYMYAQNKIGICIECGTSNRYELFLDLAEKSVYQFLQYFGIIKSKVEYSKVPQRKMKVKEVIYKTTEDFKYTADFKDFDALPEDKPFVIDGVNSRTAEVGECIIFPRPGTEIGGEAGIIGKFIN